MELGEDCVHHPKSGYKWNVHRTRRMSKDKNLPNNIGKRD